MKRNLQLLLGIPLIFIIGIVAWETKQFLWLGLYIPVVVMHYFMRREISSNDVIVMPRRDRPDITDTNYVAQQHQGPQQ
ncbi:hypothetical protein [Lysobacter sp. Root604]|uniref:hypothetical protein n=1 Tax=Lysobacter sp. Root604 TaxID=1736568 RepID=UPI0006F9D2B7|nr:hypothetical protein [Lysobacter sp. Root604]KRA20806.1 hypothetical protein ASD69_05740 [Lysobacter sp. Root604]